MAGISYAKIAKINIRATDSAREFVFFNTPYAIISARPSYRRLQRQPAIIFFGTNNKTAPTDVYIMHRHYTASHTQQSLFPLFPSTAYEEKLYSCTHPPAQTQPPRTAAAHRLRAKGRNHRNNTPVRALRLCRQPHPLLSYCSKLNLKHTGTRPAAPARTALWRGLHFHFAKRAVNICKSKIIS